MIKEFEVYSVWEGHMEALRKKVNKIQNKCKKFGCDFFYQEIGEEFKEVTDFTAPINPLTGKHPTFTCKFIKVQASGTAVINNWSFVASVEHTEKGNIFSKAMTDVEIPMRYRTTGSCICEHCHTKRARKDTCIIMNTETGEFKQVGNSCLMDFTHGMSASTATYFASLRGVFEEEENRPVSGAGWYEKSYPTDEVLRFTAETIRVFGYADKDSEYPTRRRMTEIFDVCHGNTRWMEQKEINRINDMILNTGFNPESEGASKVVENALSWLDGQEAKNDYLHNLKVVTSMKFVTSNRFGLLVSLFPTCNKDLELQAMKKKEAEQGKLSEHQGKVGDRLSIEVESVKCITSWESCFNGYSNTTTYVWKITDKAGNVFTWKTSKWMNEENPPKTIIGTVKEHKVFREVNQTELTRCKVA